MLVLGRVGKEISGTGLDCNVVGRYTTPFASGGPDITRIVALDTTPLTGGNVNGIGVVDVTTSACSTSSRSPKPIPTRSLPPPPRQ